MPTYSIWLEPTREWYVPAVRFIGREAKHSTKAPFFTPHVTLVGGFTCKDDAEAQHEFDKAWRRVRGCVSSNLVPDVVECGTKRHQCVYMKMKKTNELVKAFEAANEAMGLKGDVNAFMPHMSLAYGVEDEVERKEIAERAAAEFRECHQALWLDVISLWETDVKDDSCDSWRLVVSHSMKM